MSRCIHFLIDRRVPNWAFFPLAPPRMVWERAMELYRESQVSGCHLSSRR
jgi:hypothetical protein